MLSIRYRFIEQMNVRSLSRIATFLSLSFISSEVLTAQDCWLYQKADVHSAITSLAFTDSLNGVAVGYEGTILFTTDGGTTWQRRLGIPSEYFLENLAFPTPQIGI